ncbi:branched-chain amino acid ABC transporter permease [Bradyrhizobium sp. WYCCWR 13023]|uniref:Branched-chain amino acid ABC transporter permease n=1 Tax=Bradyrhizobium zhengyangense TaxID=2911009 RepID=A0A9X1R740_9BRAD|nr:MULTISPECIES: branched-chain amino acid ABC transporter permease [Bradyrhizobium]MCG2626187.1 branched-chain amino acid ABC transporter permease [Bradyrhizobium zhengyangense]MDA9524501.1 ABC transporter permease [Bradyrhizobium sp. CCBAU 11434]
MSKGIAISCVLAVLLLVAGPLLLGEGALRFATECLLILAMAQMWNLLAGYAGLVSFGHQVFVGIGAYGLFLISDTFELSPYWVLPIAPLAGAIVASVIALPLFRLREAYFSIAMWVFSEIVVALVMKASWLGGTSGLPLKSSRLLDLDWFEPVLFWISGSLALGTIGGLFLLMRSGFGLGLMSVRDNDLAAMSVGVDVQRNRFIVFVLSAAGCGLAGAVSFLGNLYVSPAAAFDVNWVVYMMFIVMIGGIGTLEGPIIGTVIFFGLRELITDQLGVSAGWYLVALGAIAVIVMLWSPRGLWPPLRDRFGLKLFGVGRTAPASPPDLASLAGKAGQLG